ncbi:hypothetical protein OBBRIDRAFT_789765 [Obba rivulosa]|uniref:Uncharacterized protein n=1 Tax=Obba rivulosa TaxID=1052685 RepID=A0A8E2DQK1_9APHY|nr:hypothetical protein OBBRIDRAFT_789765 [Obba rivulosa]
MSVFRASSVVSARSAVREYDLGFDALPEDTPQPKRAAHRRRVARTSERLERLTESGLAALSDEDTDKEVDELAGDDGREKKPDEEAAKVEADKDAQKQKEEQVKEVVEWEEEEEEIDQLKDDDWDPFGDGEELDW